MKHLSEETIMGLADSLLTPSERAEAEAHIAVCSDCREQLKLYQSLDELMTAGSILIAPPVITNRVMQEVELHHKIMLRKAKSRKTLFSFMLIMFVFMILLLVLAFVSGAGFSFETPSWIVSVRDFLMKLRMPRINPLFLYGTVSVLVLFFSERLIYTIHRHKVAAAR